MPVPKTLLPMGPRVLLVAKEPGLYFLLVDGCLEPMVLIMKEDLDLPMLRPLFKNLLYGDNDLIDM